MYYHNFQRRNWKNKLADLFILFVYLLPSSLFLLFFSSQNLCSQTNGLKYIKNYNTGMHSLNWAVLQDKRGVIYVANNGCILEFDGVSQRIINIPGWKVRSLAIDDEGTVYVGGVNQFGYLAADSYGIRTYVPLLDYLQENQKDFSTVYRINTANDGVYFRTRKFLFRWQPNIKKMDVWEPEKEFNASFTCNGRLYVHQRGVGLRQMIDNSLEMVHGNETFASAKIYMIAPFAKGSVLIGTRSKGFYIYDGLKVVPFPTDVDDYIKKNKLYHGIQLSSSASTTQYALATQQGGLVIIGDSGKLKCIFDKSSGLQNDVVNYVYEDSSGNLWLALDKGVSKIEYTSPISFYTEELSRLMGGVLSITEFGPTNSLMVGTTSGLFTLTSPGNSSSFRRVEGLPGNCFDLIPMGDSLLAATTYGVYQVGIDYRLKERVLPMQSFVFHPSAIEPNRVLVGTGEGLISLSRKNHKWKEDFRLENTSKTIRTIVDDQNGGLWLGTLSDGVLKVDFSSADEPFYPIVTRYNNSHGLPKGEVRVFFAAGHVIFAAGKKIYRFNPKAGKFFPDYTLGNEFADGSRNVFVLTEDKKGDIWFHSEFRNMWAIVQPNGTFVISKQPFLRVPDAQVNVIYPSPTGNEVWLGGQDNLIRFDPRIKKDYNRNFPCIIREVFINGIPRLYNKKGLYNAIDHGWQMGVPILPYRERNITFEFAAPFFENESENQYRYLLENYDERWSTWNSKPHVDYTNLGPGTYTFRVQAKNVYNHLSQDGRFRFKVLPPWYQTWWAFLIYGLVVLLFLYLVVKWRSGKLEREKKRLEQLVRERTKEVDEKNRQLEKQTELLVEQSKQLKEMDRIKSRFFANISHEFRTPLTLIIGPLEQTLANARDDEEEKQVRMMLRNSRRLLHLINQLLDLSKIDSGKMKLHARRQNIVPYLKGITASFEMIARQKNLYLSFRAIENTITLYFDTEKMEAVICNLLVNAIKFTPDGGEITVTVKKNSVGNPGCLEILVCDTGTGIPPDQLEYIFDRFYQAEERSSKINGSPGQESQGHRYAQSTGIGLALTRELVLLHRGTIDVRSRVGKESGTEFIIRLPLDENHPEPGEITTTSEDLNNGNRIPEVLQLADEKNNEGKAADMDKADNIEEPEIEDKEIILVVEDSADMRDYIRGALAPFYTVKEAIDGKEGIEKAKKIIPDLVVSDIMMPGTDGYELCNVLKKNIKTSHIPVILLTAKASEENVIQGLKSGADDYITKPFSTRILLARVKNLIDLRRQLQQNIQREMILQPAEVQVSSMDQKFIKEVQEVIEKNLSDEFFNVDQLGKKLYMSRATLYRKILALTGLSPREFIKSYRLKRGAQLLRANFGNVTEVAFEVGFSSTTYFGKCFKKKFQQLPSAFQGSDS
jgi:signal transduction histidine kinase/DNA-binding response OmpR family regulator